MVMNNYLTDEETRQLDGIGWQFHELQRSNANLAWGRIRGQTFAAPRNPTF
jgi:hypothetical protein